jgi:hypothetical protein
MHAGARGDTQVKFPEVFQVETPCVLGKLASVLNAITETGLVLEHLSTLRSDQDRTLWEITVEIDESAHAELLGRLNALPGVRFVGWSDRVFDRHRDGEIETRSRLAVTTQQALTSAAPADEPPKLSGPHSRAP